MRVQGAVGLPAHIAAPAPAPALQALPLIPAESPAWHLGCLAAAQHSPSLELAMWQAAQPLPPGASAGLVNPAIYPGLGFRPSAGLPAQPLLGPAVPGVPDSVLAQLRALGLLTVAAQGGGQGAGAAPGAALSQALVGLQETPLGTGASRLSVESFGRTGTGGSLGSNTSASGESDLSSTHRALRSSPGGAAPLGTPAQLGVVAQLLPVQGLGHGQGFAAPGQGLGAGMLRQQVPLAQGFGPDQGSGAPGHLMPLIAAGMLRQQVPAPQGLGPGQGLPAFSQGLAAQAGVPQQQQLVAQAFGPGQGMYAPGQGVPAHAALPQPPPPGHMPGYAVGLPQLPPQRVAALAMHREGYVAPDAAYSAGLVPEPGAGAGRGLLHTYAAAPQQLWPPRMPFPKP